jgi:energy-coupling factor transporter ATP-binding protein EcfA2
MNNEIISLVNKLNEDYRYFVGSKRQDALEVVFENIVTELFENGDRNLGVSKDHIKKDLTEFIERLSK